MTFRRCFLPRFGSFGEAVAEMIFWKSANQKQELPMATMKCEFLTSLGVRRLLTFHILIFSSEIAYLNEPKHLWEVLYKDFSFCPDTLTNTEKKKRF
jgi:hypothetical protein